MEKKINGIWYIHVLCKYCQNIYSVTLKGNSLSLTQWVNVLVAEPHAEFNLHNPLL